MNENDELGECSYLQLTYCEIVDPIGINQQIFSRTFHSNSTLNIENNMCHVPPPLFIGLQLVNFFFHAPQSYSTSVFHVVRTDQFHFLRSVHQWDSRLMLSLLFSGHFPDLPRFACHQEIQTPSVLACSQALCSIHTANFPL